MKHRILICIAAAVSGSCAAQSVYQCKAADGTNIYSQMPCGTHQKKLKLKKTREPDPNALSRLHDAQARQRARADSRDLDQQEAACVDSMTYEATRTARNHIESEEQRRADLKQKLFLTPDVMAAGMLKLSLRQDIQASTKDIERTRSQLKTTVAHAQWQCRQQRLSLEAANSGL
ncbi:MAG: DUF4124 domain-containing protein [Rhodanobacteraceae bacterium]